MPTLSANRPATRSNSPGVYLRIGMMIVITGYVLSESPELSAAKTEVDGRFEIGGLYESNPRLRSGFNDDATGLLLNAIANMNYGTERNNLKFSPRLQLSRYKDPEDKDLEMNNYYLDLLTDHKTVRSTTSLGASYSNVSVRTSELESADSIGGGTGDIRFATDKQRLWSIFPKWGYQISPRDVINLDARYTDVSYKESLSGRFDYTNISANAAWQHDLNEKLSAGLLLNASKFDSESPLTNITNDSKTYGGSLFIKYEFSETLTGSAYFGSRRTDSTVSFPPVDIIVLFPPPPTVTEVCPDDGSPPPCERSSSGNNFVGNIGLTKKSENTTYDMSIGRSISPNSNGAQVARDELRATVAHRLSRHLTGSLNLLYYDQEDAVARTRSRKYVSVRPSVVWHFSRRWGVRVAYRYVRSDGTFTLGGTRSNTDNHYVFLGFSFQGDPWRPF